MTVLFARARCAYERDSLPPLRRQSDVAQRRAIGLVLKHHRRARTPNPSQ